MKIRVQYQFSNNTTSVFQLQDWNIIIVFSNNQKICILDTSNIYKKIESIYSLKVINKIYFQDDNDDEESILRVIEIQNKSLVVLSKNNISFYYNKSNEIQQYNYQKYSEIKAQNEINNISILEFNDNYVVVCSGEFELNFSNNCYLTIINIVKI